MSNVRIEGNVKARKVGISGRQGMSMDSLIQDIYRATEVLVKTHEVRTCPGKCALGNPPLFRRRDRHRRPPRYIPPGTHLQSTSPLALARNPLKGLYISPLILNWSIFIDE